MGVTVPEEGEVVVGGVVVVGVFVVVGAVVVEPAVVIEPSVVVTASAHAPKDRISITAAKRSAIV